MPEDKKQRQKIRYYIKEYTCDECGEGKMERMNTRMATAEWPPICYTSFAGTHYRHRCTHCGHECEFTDISYPHEYSKRTLRS